MSVSNHKHNFSYAGGRAKCTVKGCNKYLQPDGRVTDTPTGRKSTKSKK